MDTTEHPPFLQPFRVHPLDHPHDMYDHHHDQVLPSSARNAPRHIWPSICRHAPAAGMLGSSKILQVHAERYGSVFYTHRYLQRVIVFSGDSLPDLYEIERRGCLDTTYPHWWLDTLIPPPQNTLTFISAQDPRHAKLQAIIQACMSRKRLKIRFDLLVSILRVTVQKWILQSSDRNPRDSKSDKVKDHRFHNEGSHTISDESSSNADCDRGWNANDSDSFIGSIFTSNDLQPEVLHAKLKRFLHRMTEKNEVASHHGAHGGPLDVLEEALEINSHVFLWLLLGNISASRLQKFQRIVKSTQQIFTLFPSPMRSRKASELHEQLAKFIQQLNVDIESGTATSFALLERLLEFEKEEQEEARQKTGKSESGEGCPTPSNSKAELYQTVSNHVMDAWLRTLPVAHVLCSAIYFLGSNRAVFKKLQAEVNELFPQRRKLDIELIAELPFLDSVVKEVLRIASPYPGVFRRFNQDTLDTKRGYVYPKGCMVIHPYQDLSVDPDVWDDPESFRPERFLRKPGAGGSLRGAAKNALSPGKEGGDLLAPSSRDRDRDRDSKRVRGQDRGPDLLTPSLPPLYDARFKEDRVDSSPSRMRNNGNGAGSSLFNDYLTSRDSKTQERVFKRKVSSQTSEAFKDADKAIAKSSTFCDLATPSDPESSLSIENREALLGSLATDRLYHFSSSVHGGQMFGRSIFGTEGRSTDSLNLFDEDDQENVQVVGSKNQEDSQSLRQRTLSSLHPGSKSYTIESISELIKADKERKGNGKTAAIATGAGTAATSLAATSADSSSQQPGSEDTAENLSKKESLPVQKTSVLGVGMEKTKESPFGPLSRADSAHKAVREVPAIETFKFCPFGHGQRACPSSEAVDMILKTMIVVLAKECGDIEITSSKYVPLPLSTFSCHAIFKSTNQS